MRRPHTEKTTATTRPASAAAGTPSRWSSALLVALSLLPACDDEEGKEKEKAPATASEGGATRDRLNTRIGYGKGLDVGLAPTHTEWSHVWVVDDSTAVIVGRAHDRAIALRTEDGGRTFESLEVEKKGWHSWGVDGEGRVALATGTFAEGHSTTDGNAPVSSAEIRLTTTVDDLSAAGAFFGADEPTKSLHLDSGAARPALLKRELASMVVEKGARAQLAYGVPGGRKQPEPKSLPHGRFVRAPYGRPAQLLSVRGGKVSVRPWPEPDGSVDRSGTTLSGATARGPAFEQLSAGPDCDVGPWSMTRIGSSRSAQVVAVSPKKSLAFSLPSGTTETFGCSADAVVVEKKIQKKKKKENMGAPKLLRCTLDGECSDPKNAPFELWPGEHERRVWATPTDKGLVAVMSLRADAHRWGVYLASSNDGGKTFELPRTIGKGEANRGAYRVGALIGFPDRLLLLLAADVTGASRRNWYVLASTDGGASWNVP